MEPKPHRFHYAKPSIKRNGFGAFGKWGMLGEFCEVKKHEHGKE